jgi:hypothetical protein
MVNIQSVRTDSCALKNAFNLAVAAQALEFASVFAVKVGDVPASKPAFVPPYDAIDLIGCGFEMAYLRRALVQQAREAIGLVTINMAAKAPLAHAQYQGRFALG